MTIDIVTLTTDMNADAPYCLLFDAADITTGPVRKIELPERISNGTHSTWATGFDLRGWNLLDNPGAAVGL